MDDVDELIREAGQTHVIPPREDPALLERLRDPHVLTRARELLGSAGKDTRARAILAIERIGYALNDQESAELLLRHAGNAKTQDEIDTTLTALSRLHPPNPLPSGTLLSLARRYEWRIWHAAIQCLHLAPADEVEPALLERLDEKDPHGVAYVARELRYMTSRESLVALEGLLGHRTLDVRCVALDSLGERLNEGVVPYARRIGEGRSRQEKWWAEKWLARFGDAEDVPFMAGRVKNLLSGRRVVAYSPPEVSYLVPFLTAHKELPTALKAVEAIREKADRLPSSEREWIEANASDLLS